MLERIVKPILATFNYLTGKSLKQCKQRLEDIERERTAIMNFTEILTQYDNKGRYLLELEYKILHQDDTNFTPRITSELISKVVSLYGKVTDSGSAEPTLDSLCDLLLRLNNGEETLQMFIDLEEDISDYLKKNPDKIPRIAVKKCLADYVLYSDSEQYD